MHRESQHDEIPRHALTSFRAVFHGTLRTRGTLPQVVSPAPEPPATALLDCLRAPWLPYRIVESWLLGYNCRCVKDRPVTVELASPGPHGTLPAVWMSLGNSCFILG